METIVSRVVKVRVAILILCAYCVCFSDRASAQTNSWTNSVSGNWQDAYWSLGKPPGTDQTILFTNAGWKALAIGPSTGQNFPETLTVDSITISSPANSYNTLLLDYAGIQMPLTVKSLSIESNSAVTMLSSALLLNGSNGVGLEVGGEFNQNDSLVTGGQVNVGDHGLYNLNSGVLAVSNLSVGPYGGVFNQNGGTNATGVTGLMGGDYILNDGYFGAMIFFAGGRLRQRGAILDSPLSSNCNYFLEGGVHIGNVTGGQVIQTGGTNYGDVDAGNYTISNGLFAGGIDLEGYGSFVQGGGTVAGSNVTIRNIPVYEKGGGGYLLEASAIQNGGTMTCLQMDIAGDYQQQGGSNFVAGTVYIWGLAWVSTSGWFCASNLAIQVDVAFSPSFRGTVIISNELAVLPYSSGGYYGSGNLTASNITVEGGAFSFGEGTINQSGVLTASGANLYFYGPGTFNLGCLQLNANSTLSLSSNECVLRFASSDAMKWANELFNLKQWSGSLYGGGQQQIFFGTNASSLTAQQLSQIQFQNPVGLAPGNYPARILATGEIVPDTGAPLPPVLNLICASNGPMHLSIGGDIGRSYTVEVSTDLVHWNTWTDQFNASGTMTLDDNDSTNCPQRFYRAHLMP